MAECEGAFGGFNEDVQAGVALAMINEAGATSNSPTTATDGFTGATAGGLPIEVVSVGCGDDTADRAIQEIRKIVEQDGANVVIGPLSGDEGIAIANYAKDHPEVTFINGISGAQEATLQVQAPNFFRFNGDGAQWNAGLGDILHNTAGWDTAVVIADDYGFGWTSAAGFIAEFCAVGGDVVQRVFPPLNTTDYSSFIAQLPDPDEVDGYFWVVGGTGTQASLEAFVNAKGDLNGQQHAGNLFFNPGLASAFGTGIAGAYVGGFASFAGDIQTPEIEAYAASADAAWDTLAGALTGNEPGPPSTALTFGFAYGYYLAGTGSDPGAQRGRRRPLRQPRGAPRGTVDDDAGGPVRHRHARREPSGDHRHVGAAAGPRRRRSRLQDRRHHQGCRPDVRWHVQRRHAAART